MDKSLKKRMKRYIALVLVAVLVVFLAIMPMLAGNKETDDGPVASILSGTAGLHDISTVVKGGGTLAGEEVLEISIPSGVMLKSFLVENDAYVQEGQPVAEVDRVSVMSVITQVQETLDELTKQIQETRDEKISKTIPATAGGQVKKIYAQPGDKVQDVMLNHGALAVISLDGLMAVQVKTEVAVVTGDGVVITFEDGTQAEGKVESSLEGTVVVTLEDQGYEIGTQVSLSKDGAELGTGELYIHSQWNVTGFSGTVSQVHAKEGTKITAGKNLFTLTDTGYTAAFDTLVSKRQEYEELMMELFRLYQDTTVNAPGEGRVSGVDQNSAYLLGNSGEQGWVLNFLADGPTVNLLYTNYVGQVATVTDGSWTLKLNQTATVVTDYKAYASGYTSVGGFAHDAAYTPTDSVQIYALQNQEWVNLSLSDIKAGDELMFVFDINGNVVWVIRLLSQGTTPEVPGTDATEPPAESEPSVDGEIPSDTEPSVDGEVPSETEPTVDGETTEETTPEGETPESEMAGTESTGGSGRPSGMSGMGGMGGMQQEDTFEGYPLEKNLIMSVTPEGEMTLSISIDESDIGKLYLGQEAQIRLDALRNDRFTGTITELGTSGTNNGGSSKFTVVITMERSKDMLAGMNATATMVLDTQENLLSIPVEAVCEEGDRTFVYTSYDAEKELFLNPVDVELGISDGLYVQILSGLQEGDTFWYAYYDTLDISTDVVPENPMGFSMMGM